MLAVRSADCNLPVSVDISRQSRLSVSTTYHSCLGDALSDSQCQESVYSSYSAEHNDPQVEPEPITIEHYEQLRSSLRNPTHLELPNFRSDARARLVSLTRVQFLELAMDVHDEVMRIKANEPSPSVVPPRERSSPHRNEARQKIVNLRPDLLEDLMSDIFYELGRRYPKFKETKASFDQERSFRRDDCTPTTSPVVSSPLPIVVNQDLSDLVMSGIMASVTQDLNQRSVDIISGAMSMNEIISVLGQHGCPDITSVLDLPHCAAAPIAAGGFGDIYQGQLQTGTEVAIKCPRFFIHRSEIDRSTMKAAARELHAWSKYNHPNVLGLLGVARFRDRIAMISPWMKNGTMSQYIARTPNADRYRLCGEIASGVAYLHGMGTVHGDIKGNSTLNFTGSQTASSFSIRWTVINHDISCQIRLMHLFFRPQSSYLRSNFWPGSLSRNQIRTSGDHPSGHSKTIS
ncbi:Tyrosine kinase catalytic domain protein [Ceratobasidium sp. AG-Ba]|nr:Tyrosine kinase catalytic domain protein [Ceratobasidium sp. AG-Ba]